MSAIGTKLAITEYHYGGRNEISGALSQADVLGIYGRYGVFAACIWGMSAKDTAQLAGFRAFEGFGSTGLGVSGESPAEDSVYAARSRRRRGGVSIVALNKTEHPREFTMKLKGFAPRSAAASAITGGQLSRSVEHQVSLRGGQVTFTAPPLSVITLELD